MRPAVLLVVAAALLPAASCAWGTSTQTQTGRTSAPAPRPPTRVTTAVPFARLYRRSFGVEVVVRCLQKGVTQSCVSRIDRTSDLGRKWQDITPVTLPRDLFFGSVWFAGPLTAWVTAGDCAAGTEWLYHTHQRRTALAPCPGGGPDVQWRRDGCRGLRRSANWVAPARGTDSTLRNDRADKEERRRWSRPIALPGLGAAVEFTDPLHGWLGGGGYRLGTLFSTTDGGRTWIRTKPAVPRLGLRADIAYGLRPSSVRRWVCSRSRSSGGDASASSSIPPATAAPNMDCGGHPSAWASPHSNSAAPPAGRGHEHPLPVHLVGAGGTTADSVCDRRRRALLACLKRRCPACNRFRRSIRESHG